ncbi:MAG: NADPH:quinone oxidoreductase family protein [Novosphingobium sp.]
MPRAVIADQFGPPDTYALREYDPGQPGEGQLRVAIKAAGVSFVDVLTARGEYQFKPPLPYVPGSEYAGVVEVVGAGVADFAVGDRVFGSGMGGIFAEAGLFNAANVSKIPSALDFAEAAVFPVNYQTAWHALLDRAAAKAGESLLVLGAAGGTGYAAIEVGKYLGLHVIASASSPEKQAVAKAGGADAVVTTGAADWRDQVKAANGGKDVDIVFDPVGGDATDLAFRTLGYGGRHLVIGFTGGLTALKTNLPLLKCASLVGVQMRGHAINRPEEAAANRVKVMELAAEGHFHPAIAAKFPLEDYVAATELAFSGKAAGRVVLEME